MKFWEAMKAMDEGALVRCQIWGEDGHIDQDSDAEISAFERDSNWEIYTEPETLLSFQQAVQGLKQGKKYSRKQWAHDYYHIQMLSDGLIYMNYGGERRNFKGEDFEADDWFEVKDE